MKVVLSIFVCCGLMLGHCLGAISFDLVTWDTGDGEFNWVSRDGVATVENTGGTLGMDFDATENSDIMENSDNYTGNYAAYDNLRVGFDWLGHSGEIASLYFESAAGDNSIWEYALPDGTGAFGPHVVSFSSEAGWNRVTGSDPFFTSLANVSLIGFSVLNGGIDQTWELDNWQFFLDDDAGGAVPEPGVVSFIAVAIGSAVLTARRRRKAN